MFSTLCILLWLILIPCLSCMIPWRYVEPTLYSLNDSSIMCISYSVISFLFLPALAMLGISLYFLYWEYICSTLLVDMERDDAISLDLIPLSFALMIYSNFPSSSFTIPL